MKSYQSIRHDSLKDEKQNTTAPLEQCSDLLRHTMGFLSTQSLYGLRSVSTLFKQVATKEIHSRLNRKVVDSEELNDIRDIASPYYKDALKVALAHASIGNTGVSSLYGEYFRARDNAGNGWDITFKGDFPHASLVKGSWHGHVVVYFTLNDQKKIIAAMEHFENNYAAKKSCSK